MHQIEDFMENNKQEMNGNIQGDRRNYFLKMFDSIEEEPEINKKRMENLKEIRGW